MYKHLFLKNPYLKTTVILIESCNNLIFVVIIFAGKHLSEVCKAEYPLFVKYCLWILAELAVIAADIPEGLNQNSTIKSIHFYMFLTNVIQNYL